MDGARAIADPVRRDILELLHSSPLPAGRVAEHFDISRPAISKHLAVLTDCGVVEVNATGRQRIYSLNPGPLLEVAAFIHALATPIAAANLDALVTEVARTRRDRRTAEHEIVPAIGQGTQREKRA